jgi:hypothetical protein
MYLLTNFRILEDFKKFRNGEQAQVAAARAEDYAAAASWAEANKKLSERLDTTQARFANSTF